MLAGEKTVIIGIGNPLLGDDGVGIRVVRELEGSLAGRSDVALRELYCGGLRLVEAMVGYDRAVVVDALVTGRYPPGTVVRLTVAESFSSRNASSSHDADFRTAWELGVLTGLPLPAHLTVWGVEAGRVDEFTTRLTGDVAAAVPRITGKILSELQAAHGCTP